MDIVTLIAIDSYLKGDIEDAAPCRDIPAIDISDDRALNRRRADEQTRDGLAHATWEDAEWQ